MNCFARNVPSNVSKTQDFRPKMNDYFAIWGPHPFSGVAPSIFEIYGSVTEKYTRRVNILPENVNLQKIAKKRLMVLFCSICSRVHPI
jgi:hypothetical protein